METPPTDFMPRRNFLALSALGGGLTGLVGGALILLSQKVAV